MQVIYNGAPRDLSPGATVSGLLAELKLASRPVAVEVNGDVVPRERHGDVILQAGDRVEVVTLVGGG
jgi:sulfur carrier protein